MANAISKEIISIAYAVSKYSQSYDCEKELLIEQEKLKKVVRKVLDEYEIIINKNEMCISEINGFSEKTSIERGILYRLNKGIALTVFQIEAVEKILQEKEYTKEKQVIILEYIRIHNIKCSFTKPKVSYTTINMMQNDFELYNVEDLMDIKSKNKLDDYVNTMFEAVFLEEDLSLDNFIDTYICWMNKEEYEYTMQSVLNKFLIELKKCQTEMIKEYDDIELRKIVIEDYNHYYYMFLKLKQFYEKNNEIIVEDEITEEMIDNNIQTNNLFFAMSGDVSYVQKDIEAVPKEYLERVKKLLEGFKNNMLVERNIEGFTSNDKLKGFRKLKDDQVRIVFKTINNNNYLILGIMVKKENKGTRQYVSIVKRDYNYSIETEQDFNNKLNESNIIYANIMEYIDENVRKGNR